MKLSKKDVWKFSTIVLAAILVFTITGNIVTGRAVGKAPKTADGIKDSAMDFINKYMLRGVYEAEFVSFEEKDGVYNLTFLVEGMPYNVFLNKDGRTMYPEVIDMPVFAEQMEEIMKMEEELYTIPKSDRPKVELFVMSMCPYGVQAENGLYDVQKLFGDKMDLQLYFIAREMEDGSFGSLHGQKEVDENIRQVCIVEHAKDKLWDYLKCVNEDYTNAEDNWEACTTSAGIDTETIKACFEGEEGAELFRENIKRAEELGVGGSPTIYINGGMYGGGRGAEDFKTGICEAFNSPPEECDTKLGEATSTVTGSC